MEHGGSTAKLWLSFLLGLLFAALGVVSALAYLGVMLPIPAIIMSPLVIKISLIIAGLLLFVDSFSVRTMTGQVKFASILIALLLAVIGAIPLLLDYKLLGFLPFVIEFTIPPIVLSIVLAIYGLYLVFTAVQLYKTYAMGFY